MKLKSLIAAVAMTAASAVMAAPTLDTIVGSGPALQDKGQNYFQLTDTDGVIDDIFTIVLSKDASLAHNVGIYAFTTDAAGVVTVGDKLQILTGAAVGSGFGTPGVTYTDVVFNLALGTATANGVTANIGSTFGFYLEAGAETFFSHASLNTAGVDNLAVFETKGQGGVTNGYDLILAWDDQVGGDKDYNDLVIGVHDVIAIPEPGTLALLGLGLAGLGFARRRTAKKA